jgi:hypothetical protein
MRFVVSVLVALSVLASSCSPKRLTRHATLIIPAELVLRGYDVDLQPLVELLWNEADAVSIKVVIATSVQPDGHSPPTRVFGVLKVFDESGKDMKFNGMYMGLSRPSANGTINVPALASRNSGLKLPFYSSEGQWFDKPGRYCAVAEFSGVTSRGEQVTFQTQKQWFQLNRPE